MVAGLSQGVHNIPAFHNPDICYESVETVMSLAHSDHIGKDFAYPFSHSTELWSYLGVMKLVWSWKIWLVIKSFQHLIITVTCDIGDYCKVFCNNVDCFWCCVVCVF